MANVSESAVYDAGVYQLETTDPVAGGASGVSNNQAKNLANRTAYLKAHLDLLEAGTTVPAGIATLNSPAFTGDPTCPTAALGDNDTSLSNTAFVQATLAGILSKSVAGSSNVTLTTVEAGNGILIFTGLLTGNINVIVPTRGARWQCVNSTSGAFTLTVKTAAGTGVLITQGKSRIVYGDATNIVVGDNDVAGLALDSSATCVTAAVGDSSTSPSSTAFVQTAIAGVTTKSVAGNSNVTLSQSEWGNGVLAFTGLLTGNINVIVPSSTDNWIVSNGTTGAFTLTVKTSGGTGIAVPQSQAMHLYCDATNVLNGVTSAFLKSGDTMTGQINEAPSVTIASGSTVNIGAAAANTVHISGTTTVTAFGTVAEGVRRRVIADAALPITYNSTSMKLIGAANITCAAGDSFDMLSLGSGNWLMIGYDKTGSLPATVGGTETLTNKTLTNPTVTNYVETVYVPSAGSAFTVDLANGTRQRLTTNANCTITLPTPVAGKSYVIEISYGGSHTITWAGGGTIKWPAGTAPTATSVNGKRDKFGFDCTDTTNTDGSTIGQNY